MHHGPIREAWTIGATVPTIKHDGKSWVSATTHSRAFKGITHAFFISVSKRAHPRWTLWAVGASSGHSVKPVSVSPLSALDVATRTVVGTADEAKQKAYQSNIAKTKL